MNEEIYEKLKQIAPVLEPLSRSTDPSLHYSVFADALYWSDELPPSYRVPGGTDILRFILHYRTSLILGREDHACLEYWNAGKQLFPRWIGFRPERCAPDHALQTTYRLLRDAAETKLLEEEHAGREGENRQGVADDRGA